MPAPWPRGLRPDAVVTAAPTGVPGEVYGDELGLGRRGTSAGEDTPVSNRKKPPLVDMWGNIGARESRVLGFWCSAFLPPEQGWCQLGKTATLSVWKPSLDWTGAQSTIGRVGERSIPDPPAPRLVPIRGNPACLLSRNHVTCTPTPLPSASPTIRAGRCVRCERHVLPQPPPARLD